MSRDKPTLTRRRFLASSGAAATATVPAFGTAAAESSSRGILANGLSVEGGDRRAFIKGFWNGTFSLSRTEPAERLAGQMRNEFQANRDAWIRYGNWLIEEFDDVEPAGSVTVGVDVVVTRWIGEDEIVSTTVRAEYDDVAQEFTDLEWVTGEPEDPHYKFPIRNSAAEFAADDLLMYRQRFIGESVDDHKIPDKEFVSQYAGKYLAATKIDKETAHALNVFVGDLNGA